MNRPSNKQMKQLVEAAWRNYEGMASSRMCLTIFSKGYEKDPVALMQFALAILLDKPLYLMIEKGRPIPANVRAVAAGIEEYDPSGPEEDFQAAATRLMTKATKGM
jgi:hypothetical protein